MSDLTKLVEELRSIPSVISVVRRGSKHIVITAEPSSSVAETIQSIPGDFTYTIKRTRL